jgi:hypothetical protein
MHYRISATDGTLGKVKDLLFDDQLWVSRYLVVDSSAWLPGRRVLITPSALREPNWETGELPVELTMEQVKNSPGIEEDQPVSRQHEVKLHHYYDWPPYWPGPEATPIAPAARSPETETETLGDSHLRSVREVTGYHIAGADGEIGHAEDFIVEDETWWLRYIVVDTKNWLPGRKVLVSLQWIRKIDWNQRMVEIDLLREQIKASPRYDPTAAVNRGYEEQLFDFYGRPKYWG